MTQLLRHLSETALAFAREVLSWDDAIPETVLGAPILCRKSNPLAELFYTDLNDVMSHVREWLASNEDLGFVLRYTRRGKFGAAIQDEAIWPAEILGGDEHEARFDNPCQALMQACLEAACKLKAGAA